MHEGIHACQLQCRTNWLPRDNPGILRLTKLKSYITWSTLSSAVLEANPSSFHINQFVHVVPNTTYLQTTITHRRRNFETASERDLSDDDQSASSDVTEVVRRPSAPQKKAVRMPQ